MFDVAWSPQVYRGTVCLRVLFTPEHLLVRCLNRDGLADIVFSGALFTENSSAGKLFMTTDPCLMTVRPRELTVRPALRPLCELWRVGNLITFSLDVSSSQCCTLSSCPEHREEPVDERERTLSETTSRPGTCPGNRESVVVNTLARLSVIMLLTSSTTPRRKLKNSYVALMALCGTESNAFDISDCSRYSWLSCRLAWSITPLMIDNFSLMSNMRLPPPWVFVKTPCFVISDFSENFATVGVNLHKLITLVTPHWWLLVHMT